MPYLKQNAPYTVPTILETPGNPQVVDVTVFDFKKQLLSLLNDRFLFGNIDNLDVNKSDPFARYKMSICSRPVEGLGVSIDCV